MTRSSGRLWGWGIGILAIGVVLWPLVVAGGQRAEARRGQRPAPRAPAAADLAAKGEPGPAAEGEPGPVAETAPADPQERPLADYLTERADPSELLDDADGERRRELWKTLERFYRRRAYEPAWIGTRRGLFRTGHQLGEEAGDLLGALLAAGEHGLDPDDYDVAGLAADLERAATKKRLSPEEMHDLDVRLTTAFLLYGTHLLSGRIDPDDIDIEWYTEPRRADLALRLEAALRDGGVAKGLARLAPQHEGYRLLQRALTDYRRLAAAGGWPEVPAGETLEPGAAAPAERLAALVTRLELGGDLSAREAAEIRKSWQPDTAAEGAATAPAVRPVYDERLAAAVERFQERHGLKVDGKVGANTLAAINVPVEQRVRQIELNLERWRWMPARFGEDHIRVNVPDFRLRGYRDGREAIEMKVVVGQPSWRTPIFSDQMTYVEINPYWNVPRSIASEEILPHLRNDPGYLAANGYEVVADGGQVVDPYSVDWSNGLPYRIRQKPGPRNALGQIKFMFPNRHNVYLHDTPAEHAFGRTERALSHGCVRVERPLDLAGFVFAEKKGWSQRKARRTIGKGEREVVQLDEPLPVFILYHTAFAEDGTAQFRDDVYHYDAVLAAALERRDQRLAMRPRTRPAEARAA